jgi:flavin reductase (DIM6/NTAB) family NADH-FMN oxidoreductase RutF
MAMTANLATTVNLSPPLVLSHGIGKNKSREKMRTIIAQSNEQNSGEQSVHDSYL